MFSSNISALVPVFSLAQWGILFFIGILCVIISIRDIQHRLIPNTLLIPLILLVIIWNSISYRIGYLFQTENLLQIVVLVFLGTIVSARNTAGAWDLKLTFLLAFFFLSLHSPLIFVGNIAVITLVFLAGYIIGGMTRLVSDNRKREKLTDDIQEHLQTAKKLTKRWAMMELLSEKKEPLSLWVFLIFIISLFRFFLLHAVIPTYPELAILGTYTASIFLFFGMSPLLRSGLTGKHQKYWLGGCLVSVFTMITWTSNSGNSELLIESLTQTVFFLATVTLSLMLLQRGFLFLLAHIDDLGSDHRSHTLPYSLFIIVGFFLTMLTDAHLASEIIQGWSLIF